MNLIKDFRKWLNLIYIRKKSLSNYNIASRYEKHDRRFWNTVSPFMSDKKFRNGGGIILEEARKTISEVSKVSEIYNDFFTSVASEIGFDEDIVSVADAINEYNTHPSIERI